jgi:protein SCO1/2
MPLFRIAALGFVWLAANTGWGLAADDGDPGRDTPPPLASLFGGPFSLVDHDGARRTDLDFSGRHMLIYFGYATCPDICPTGLQTLSTALDLVGARANVVQPLFVTVDPARDRPDVLKDYIQHFHPRLIGLTGTEAEIRAVAKAYRVHRRKVEMPDSAGPEDYLVDHASITYVMGPDGKHLTLFPHGTDAERMAEILTRYLP